jgi:hypothetical protein
MTSPTVIPPLVISDTATHFKMGKILPFSIKLVSTVIDDFETAGPDRKHELIATPTDQDYIQYRVT